VSGLRWCEYVRCHRQEALTPVHLGANVTYVEKYALDPVRAIALVRAAAA
jgi:hypothetical protein